MISDSYTTSEGDELIVLAVEDQHSERCLLVAQLQSLGATTVLEAGDGAEALEVIDAHPGRIALIFTDIDMPTLDGLALLRQIGQRMCTVPVVVLSGLDAQLLRSVEAMSRAFGVNLLAVVTTKPPSPDARLPSVDRRLPRCRAGLPVREAPFSPATS